MKVCLRANEANYLLFLSLHITFMKHNVSCMNSGLSALTDLVSDWLMTSKASLLIGCWEFTEILVRAKCKHIPDDLWRWQANIVTTICIDGRQK